MDGQHTNLKNRKGKLLYYREYKTGNSTPVRQKKGTLENHLHFKPVVEKKYFDESTIKKWTLDTYGGPSPQVVEGNFTILHNYLLDYWGMFLGAEAIAIYAYLRRRCNMKENRDYCWPSIEDIGLRVKKSRNTVVKYLEILETYGFIYRFYVEDPSRNNAKESPIIKVRMLVPFLPQELVEQLEPETKEKHDAEISRYFENPLLLGKETEESLVYHEVYEMLEEKAVSSILKTERKRKKEAAIFEFEKASISEKDRTQWASLLSVAEKKVSKPSFDTWFKNTYATFNEFDSHIKVTIYCPNQFTLEWLKERYSNLIIDWLNESIGEMDFHLSFNCPLENNNNSGTKDDKGLNPKEIQELLEEKSEESKPGTSKSSEDGQQRVEFSDKDKNIWNSVLNFGMNKISKPSFDTWLKNTSATFKEVGGNSVEVTIFTRDDFAQEWVEERYSTNILEWLNEILGRKDFTLHFSCLQNEDM
ncbi:DnaA N-terminal domain-containing protein [Mesobacillus sp.]|uniref:DnaA N-terminal domain-containing protein n=1 Tax=Mesobacillus sp. TaxID=2675271 RepID=UPI0039EF9A07